MSSASAKETVAADGMSVNSSVEGIEASLEFLRSNCSYRHKDCYCIADQGIQHLRYKLFIL